ncbi:MAG: NCS2 family permease, partial [Erysipelotrichaceae bacterium]
MNKIAQFFKFEERKTNLKTEIVAGLTTFMTMAYVLVVQPSAIVGFGNTPSMIDINGVLISKEAIVVVCAIVSALITFFMALYANLPFALATGMGSNFMFGALLQAGELSFGSIMSMVLISGLVFLALSVFGVRDLIVR